MHNKTLKSVWDGSKLMKSIIQDARAGTVALIKLTQGGKK